MSDDIQPGSHRHYEFGTFEQRLAHLRALFETTSPEFPRGEDGGPELNEEVMEWITQHEINMDWLFAGSPCSMLCKWATKRADGKEFVDTVGQLEPEVQAGLLAFMRAVVIHGVPMKEAEPVFTQVLAEYRAPAGKAA